jgi:uncharacterized lipoprotein YddW (UPF0748 family)
MEFGLWFEPEMINLDSTTARKHPDWIMSTGDRLPVESRHQQVINLGIPECYAYVRDAMFEILAEYKISYIKWDHNRDLIDAGSAPDGRPGSMSRHWPSTGSSTRSRPPIRGWKSNPARREAPVLILVCWRGPTAFG